MAWWYGGSLQPLSPTMAVSNELAVLRSSVNLIHWLGVAYECDRG